MKPRVFWFHYNKPESLKQQQNVLTVHQAGVCHLVHELQVLVPVVVRHRKSQPRCVLAGKGVLVITKVGGRVFATIYPTHRSAIETRLY